MHKLFKTGPTSCPSGWHKYNSHCYQKFESSTKLSQAEAQTRCEKYQGNLVTINTADINDYIGKTFQ